MHTRLLPFVALLIVYLLGAWFIDIMDIDSSQYASIAKEMMQTGSYLEIKNRGEDYLDKPPLLFWVASLFFQLFGVSVFVFRLPAIIFSCVGLYATYRLARLYYNEKIAYLSALITGSCYAFFLMHHDLRTDTMLTAAVMIALWQLAYYLERGGWLYLIGGSSAVAWAMLAKGPIGLMVPILAFSTDFILKRRWLNFFRWQWLVGLCIVALWLLPMCIGLYLQFDAQPQKIINGVKGESGLYFYFWKQSFGRLTGENSWNNAPPLTFLLENFLSWSFLPWAFLFIPAFFWAIFKVLKQQLYLNPTQEGISLGGFILPFIALSLSKFQLPHYTFIIHPLAGIMTAIYLHELAQHYSKHLLYKVAVFLQGFAIIALLGLGLWLNMVAFPYPTLPTTIASVFFFGLGLKLLLLPQNSYQSLFWASFWVMIGVSILINTHVYPQIFQYQASSVLAKSIKKAGNIPHERIFAYRRLFGDNQDLQLHSFDFHSPTYIKDVKKIQFFDTLSNQSKQDFWVYTDTKGLAELQQWAKIKAYTLSIEKQLDKFHVSMLSPEFLNPATRPKTLQKIFFAKISPR